MRRIERTGKFFVLMINSLLQKPLKGGIPIKAEIPERKENDKIGVYFNGNLILSNSLEPTY